MDDVKPIADLVNHAAPGAAPRFVDRVGDFQVQCDDRALVLSGRFPEATVWRFDLTTFDGQFDMRKLYVRSGNCAFPDDASIWTRKHAALLGDLDKGRTYCGPWEIFDRTWLVPTARVALDGQHVYTSWFDLPSLEDQRAGRVYASFALNIEAPGRHEVRVSFDDFVYGTRWRVPRWPSDKKPEVQYGKNDLRPCHVGSIAIGVDERVRALAPVSLRTELRGKHPRLPGKPSGPAGTARLSLKDVEAMLRHVDPDQGKPWEYSIDAESMASDNDMDSGKHGLTAARNYDQCVARLAPEASQQWDSLFRKRFQALYTFFVFQRNYHPTGYAQNHSSATVIGLIAAGLAWDGPEAERWLRWGVMICRKRVELLGRDGGLEWMNEGRDYGLGFFQSDADLVRETTGVDVAAGHPFFQNEWRYALHQAPAFPKGPDRRPALLSLTRGAKAADLNVPVPAHATPDSTPANWHFADLEQVYMRADWGEDSYRARLWAGSVFGANARIAKRFNWAHCLVNQGSFVLSRGRHDLILEPGWTRTYRKTAAAANCILVNDMDQWGGGQVWHPKLEPEQISRIAFFVDGTSLAVARADLKNAYPPEAKVKAISRCLIHVKPELLLLFDRVETLGKGKAEWRFHAAYVDPAGPASRFTAFACDAKPALGNTAKTYEEAFKRLPDVRCDVIFLTPGVSASVKNTDTYFRWSAYSRPQRHLRVVQEGDRAITLLTAFGPKVQVNAVQNVYRGTAGDRSWVALVGGGAADGLETDGHFAIAVSEAKTRRAELMRFGGTALSYRGAKVPGSGEDAFAVVQDGKVLRTVLPNAK